MGRFWFPFWNNFGSFWKLFGAKSYPKNLSEHTSFLGIVFTSKRLRKGGLISQEKFFFELWNLPGARLLLERSGTSIFDNFGSVLTAKNIVWGL